MRMWSETLKFYFNDLNNRGSPWTEGAKELSRQWEQGTITTDDDIYAAYLIIYNKYANTSFVPPVEKVPIVTPTIPSNLPPPQTLGEVLSKYGPWVAIGGVVILTLISAGSRGGKKK